MVNELQEKLVKLNDGEALDGDQTEDLAKVFLAELDQLNANV